VVNNHNFSHNVLTNPPPPPTRLAPRPSTLGSVCLLPRKIFAAEFEDEWTKAMLIAASEREVEAEENGGGAAVNGTTTWREDESPDEPLPEVPTPSPDVDEADAAERIKQRLPHRAAPLPPPNTATESAEFKKFRAMLEQAATDAVPGQNECAALWENGATVVRSLEGTDGFDKNQFTHFLYREL
jgi:hypothetical protein